MPISQNNAGFPLHMDISDLSMTMGSVKTISQGSTETYRTNIFLVLPVKQEDFTLGEYQVELDGKSIPIKLSKIFRPEDDPILWAGGDWQIGTAGAKLPTLPFKAFTDNRGEYPTILAELAFPYRLASWLEKGAIDYEELQITGPSKDKDKIVAIKVLNRLLKQPQFRSNAIHITYDDITAFLTGYRLKDKSETLLRRLVALSSKDAYKNAIYDYFLGKDRPTPFAAISFTQKTVIADESDLAKVILTVINNVIKHHIEDRHWIEPFWDGERKYHLEGKNFLVPSIPKRESHIQPTLHVLLHELLNPLGIHVVRESDEGIGLLDFKCLYTTPSGIPVSISIEFKLAQHTGIKRGIIHQLPSYIQASKSRIGIFVVMWFKDEKGKFFREPDNRTKEEMFSWLQETAEKVKKEKSITIIPILIDASIRPSASEI